MVPMTLLILWFGIVFPDPLIGLSGNMFACHVQHGFGITGGSLLTLVLLPRGHFLLAFLGPIVGQVHVLSFYPSMARRAE